MIYSIAKTYALSFIQTDAAEKFDRACLLTAGNGAAPDYSKLELTAHAKPGEWRAQVPEMVAAASRVPPPRVAPPEETPPPPLSSPVVSAAEPEDPPGSL